MSKEQPKPLKFEELIEKLSVIPIGNKIKLNVITDYKTVQHPQHGSIVVPQTTDISLEFSQTTRTFVIDFLKRIHDTSPIIAVKYESIEFLEPPEQIQKLQKLLATPCKSCEETPEDCNCEQ